jgi:hypothetical protein
MATDRARVRARPTWSDPPVDPEAAAVERASLDADGVSRAVACVWPVVPPTTVSG